MLGVTEVRSRGRAPPYRGNKLSSIAPSDVAGTFTSYDQRDGGQRERNRSHGSRRITTGTRPPARPAGQPGGRAFNQPTQQMTRTAARTATLEQALTEAAAGPED